MRDRIVVSCRLPAHAVLTHGARSYLERARALTRRAEALGAQLVAWSATTLAFAWDTDAVEEAIALAVSLREEGGDTESWSCGIAQGMMEPLSVTDRRADLAWGEPLVHAVALSRVAEAAEVLVDESVEVARNGELRLLSERIGRDAGKDVRGTQLDTNDPWGRPSDMPVETDGADVDDFAARMIDATRQALISGNARSLQRLSDGLRATGSHDNLADRMRALARLSRGQISEALRSLQRARILAQDQPPAMQCQASLALAFALATAGQPDDAMLEGLDALARAREGTDRKAEGACLAFLAKLFVRVGQRESAAAIAQALTQYPRTTSYASLMPPKP